MENKKLGRMVWYLFLLISNIRINMKGTQRVLKFNYLKMIKQEVFKKHFSEFLVIVVQSFYY